MSGKVIEFGTRRKLGETEQQARAFEEGNAPPPPIESVIKTLEAVLAQAKTGDISAVCILGFHPTPKGMPEPSIFVSTDWLDVPAVMTLGLLETAKAMVLTDMLNTDEEEMIEE